MIRLVIDTCVYVSYFASDSKSDATRTFFKRLSPASEFILPTLVVCETLVSLAKVKYKKIELVLESFQKLLLIDLDSNFVQTLLKLLTSQTSMLKTSDLIIALTAKLHNATLVTWDKQLLSQNICPTVTPQKFK